MKMKYCTNCDKFVKPAKRDWSWVAFFVFFGVFYPIYRIFVPSNTCPICRGKTLISKEKYNLLKGEVGK